MNVIEEEEMKEKEHRKFEKASARFTPRHACRQAKRGEMRMPWHQTKRNSA